MIEYNGWFIPELLTKFIVKKVHYEPHAESYWLLQYKNYEPIFVYDKFFQTLEKDEKLIGKKIEAHINANVSQLLPAVRKKIIISKGGDNEWGKYKPVIISGIYSDIIQSKINDETYIDYKLDSIFPALINDIPENTKIGDWVTATVEDLEIVLPGRKNNFFNKDW